MKIFDENSIEKMEFFYFYFYFGKVSLKIEPVEITPFFYNNVFGFGEGKFPPSPLATPLGATSRCRSSVRSAHADYLTFLTSLLNLPVADKTIIGHFKRRIISQITAAERNL